MKKISFIALALCGSVAVFAQETQPQLRTPMASTTRFGVRGGINLANLKFSEEASGTETNSQTSFVAGVLANIPISGMFKFQPEINYSSQGAKIKGSGVSAEQDLGYINVPLNFQLQTASGFFVQTGPQVGYLLSAKAKGTVGGTTSEEDNKEEFDKIDLSWSAGLGYLSRIGLGIDLRYNYGIENIIEDNTAGVGTVKNRVAQISLVYHFGAAK